MPKAKKLPSGRWRCLVYSNTDSDGKRHYESFTASTKTEATRLAAEYAENKKRLASRRNMTVEEACSRFIEIRRPVASPSTITAYCSYKRNYIDGTPFGKIKIGSLERDTLQIFASNLACRVSAKSTRNIYFFVTAAIGEFISGIKFDVQLPTVPPVDYGIPDDADIKNLYAAASPKLKKAILLAAFGTLRRGEAAAVKYGDINRENGTIYIHADFVQNDSREWVYKPYTKTIGSVRCITPPAGVIQALGDGDPDDFIVGYLPPTITNQFVRIRNKLGLTNIRFHDLRAYSASLMDALGLPMTYVQGQGGWKSDATLKRVYLRRMNDKQKQFSAQFNAYFDNNFDMQHEMQHDSR